VNEATDVARRPIYRAEKPVRNALYKRFVKGFACAACDSTRCVDPAHTGSHGLSQKSADRLVIPLCRKCHDLFDADPRGFAKEKGLDVAAEIEKFNTLWERRQKGAA
jgi:hypothetical protein